MDSLLSVISASVGHIKDEYAKAGHTIPSLDSTEPYPLDSVQPSLELKRAVQTLEGACAQLTATVASPVHTILNCSMAGYEVACLRVVTETKVPDHLQSAGEAGLSLSDLSSKTSIDEGKLGRIMRLLATKHVFRELKKDVFVNNRLSSLLKSTHESNTSSLTLHFTDECTLASTALYNTLADSEYGSSYAPDTTALTKVYDMEKGKSVFTWYTEDSSWGERFGRAMIGWGKATSSGSLTTAYPWSSLPAGATVTDVGGGLGHISMELAQAFPQLKVVVQDLPATVEQGRKHWEKTYPEDVESQRAQFVAMDFFKEAPVQGSNIYYESLQILQNVRKAMRPGSKVLLYEYILQHVNRVSEANASFPQAPEPLLPNYRIGCVRQYNLDLDMMCMLNSKERTLHEFAALGEKAGLKFLKAYNTGEKGIVKFELA